jgi:FAD/FMN-containing dehydrogenase
MSDFVLSLKAALTQRGHRVLLSRPPVPLTPGSEAAPREEEEIEAESLDLCCFGHIGDGNLHLNLLLRCGTEATVRALQSDLDSIVYAEVIRLGGILGCIK